MRLLREATVTQPANVTLHYDLAVAVTHLQVRDEAIREFQWVVANAPASSPEAGAARQWLREARVGGAGTAAAARPASEADRGPVARVKGQMVWNDAEDPLSASRLQLFLKGLPNSPTSEQYYVLRTDNDGQFEFKQVVPGPYKLTDRIAGSPAGACASRFNTGRRRRSI